MCSKKENCDCNCGLGDDNALDELFTYKEKQMTEEKNSEKEEVIEINGVEYVRKNDKKLLKEPVLQEEQEGNTEQTLLTE